MKDVYQIFDESFATILRFLENAQYDNCYKISSDMTRIASVSEFTDGILVSEILESVFSQLSTLFGSYKIDEVGGKLIKDQLKEQISLLSKNYRIDDKNKVYPILRDLRSMVTQFQFKCWNTMSEKVEPEFKRIVRRM